MSNNNSIHSSEKKILYSILLVGILFIIKLFGGLYANSLALLSDSLHLITDAISLFISWIGLKAALKPANQKYTYGHYRHSILTALINNIFLISISIFIMYKAVIRFLHPMPVESRAMLLFSGLGIIFNTIILLALRKNADNINVKSAFLHFMGDIVGDIAVLIGSIVIYFTGISKIDTILSAILSILILRSALAMAHQCIIIFLEATPNNIDIINVRSAIKNIDNVVEVTDIHIWSLSNEVVALTAHVCVNEVNIERSEEILHKIHHLLKEKFNISHTTIQFEHAICSSCYHSKIDHKGQCDLCIDSIQRD